MSINLLAISVGNTRTRCGTFTDDKLVDTAILENHELDRCADTFTQAYEPLRNQPDIEVLLATVAPPISNQIERILEESLGVNPKRVGRDIPIPIGRQLDPEAIVGNDRLLNAAAAYDTLKQACVIVDAGTTITVDFVDGAGTFHGGAICPGAKMQLDSMHHGTALLPEIELTTPPEPIGHNTTQAMLTGVFYGVRGMVRELVEQFAEEAGAYPMVVATGGNADLLFKGHELIERVVPDLTLLGMAVTLRSAIEALDA